MDFLLRRLARSGVRRAFAGEHWAWYIIAIAAFALRRAREKGDPVVMSMPIKGGEQFLVTLRDPASSPS